MLALIWGGVLKYNVMKVKQIGYFTGSGDK